MATIETALGPIDASTLGFTLAHEHVVASGGEDLQHYPWMFDRARSVAAITETMRQWKAAGGIDAVIDLTPPDLGRDVELAAECSRGSGIHVIVSSGMWRDIPRSFLNRDIDESAEIFVHEIEVGIGATSIKAGVMKIANDVEGIGQAEENVLRAVARACKQTGCPISTHHDAVGKQGLEQIRIFREEGVQMDRVGIGHSSDSTDVAYLEQMLNAGVYLVMDRYPGREGRPDSDARNATVKALIDKGWASKIMLGHDLGPGGLVRVGRERVTPTYAPEGWLHLPTVALPRLMALGVTQADVDMMMREVPRRFLSGE